MTEKAQSDSALGHLRVVELGDIPASYATRWLADLGADVIKVEPAGGDPNRMLPPFAGNITDPERSLAFIHANTNKRSIVLDLARETDRDTFTKLLGCANLLVEATPLGYLENLGFDDEALRNKFPRTVIVSITAFGRTGPYRRYKGSDAIANASTNEEKRADQEQDQESVFRPKSWGGDFSTTVEYIRRYYDEHPAA